MATSTQHMQRRAHRLDECDPDICPHCEADALRFAITADREARRRNVLRAVTG